MGLVELKVASAHKQLDVAVSLDARDGPPGRPGHRHDQGHPPGHAGEGRGLAVGRRRGRAPADRVPDAEPDEDVLRAYGLGVDAGTNWNRLARLADPESGDPDEGGDGGASADGQRVRSKFVSSAYWAPMLVTDAKGEIAFTFTAPDNLTAFRLMAVAADVGDRFGAGELRLTVNKPLMAAPALPRFLRSGDAASVGVVIHNRTDHAGHRDGDREGDRRHARPAARRQVAVPANGPARVRFAAKASDNASASFEFAVALGAERDAVARHRCRSIARGSSTTGCSSRPGSAAAARGPARSARPPTCSAQESQLVITIDRSGVGDLAPGLRSLVEYPYGCLEQTMSRFIPLVAAKDLAKTLDDPSLAGTKANQFIRAGTAKVIRHQQGDGLFSLWPQSQTYPHLAAYALWGLTVAQQAGETIPAEVFERGHRGAVVVGEPRRHAQARRRRRDAGDGRVRDGAARQARREPQRPAVRAARRAAEVGPGVPAPRAAPREGRPRAGRRARGVDRHEHHRHRRQGVRAARASRARSTSCT